MQQGQRSVDQLGGRPVVRAHDRQELWVALDCPGGSSLLRRARPFVASATSDYHGR
jgi:hypothetical protein